MRVSGRVVALAIPIFAGCAKEPARSSRGFEAAVAAPAALRVQSAPPRCENDDACSDHVFCNGRERCSPHEALADSRGCVAALPMPVCSDRELCDDVADRCIMVGIPACATYHAEGWLMDCTEYRVGGALVRHGLDVARRACSISQGTFSTDGCPRTHLLGTCENPDTIGFYYPDPHERVSRDDLRRTCETPLRDGSHGTFHPPPR